MPSVLQRELKKKQAFELPEQEATLNVVRTADVLLRRFAVLFKGHGLSDSQYNVLRILRGHGGDGLPCREIADRMIKFDPDITRLVDRLEEAGYVERNRGDADRRVVQISITELGLKVLSKLDEPVNELHKRLLGHMTRAELADISRLMVKVREACDET